MASFKNLTFLKVLATIAWADGEITESELNVLKKFYRKFDLDKQALDSLKPYLLAPISKKEQDKLFRQLVAELGSEKERQAVVAELEEMVNADLKIKDEEKALLAEFSELLKKSSFTKRSIGRLRNFFQATLFKPAHEKNPALHKYFKNSILRKMEIKNASSKKRIKFDEDEVYFICLLGTLLASVAQVDDHFHDEEKKALKKILKERFDFKGLELQLVFDVIEDQARQGFDFYEVTTEFNRLCSYNDRVNTVDCFFVLAAADGKISYEESEEIRRITKAMHISHSLVKEAKKKMLEQLRFKK